MVVTKERESKETKKAKAWTGILRGVHVVVFWPQGDKKGYVLLKELRKNDIALLDAAPAEIDVSPDKTALVNLSRYAEFAVADDVGHPVNEWEGQNVVECFDANVKLRHSEYDYKAGKNYRAGHASRLELIGIRFVGEISANAASNMEGL